jgi:epoxyqueuosine reductase
VDRIPQELLVRLCQAEGLTHLASLDAPASLDPAGLERMLADGIGDLAWIARERDLRLRPTGMLPTARSILCVAWHYWPGEGLGVSATGRTTPFSRRCDVRPSPDDPHLGGTAPGGLRRAAYAAGKDYHDLLRPKLGRVGRALNAACGQSWEHRACVDSAPLNERTLARLAGLGWLGKNALLISPDTGSYRLLGFLLTEAPLTAVHGGHGEDRCGSCTRCETACPTKALSGGRCLTERCISYLTIEHQGVIPRALATQFNGWWFGCDICQEVCPWNRFAPPGEDRRLAGRDHEADLLAVTADSYDRHFAGRAIRRLGWPRYRRNLLVALWSLGRLDEARVVAADGLELVQAQAAELELGRNAPGPGDKGG